MPYRQIEQINERKGEKVAFMLTAENAMGLVIGALPLYLLTGSLALFPRVILIIVAAVLGVIATIEIGGMTPADRLIWTARGTLRSRIGNSRITPEQLPGVICQQREERVLRADGPIKLARSASKRIP